MIIPTGSTMLVLFMFSFCNAQESYFESDTDLDAIDNGIDETTNCIGTDYELESYVKSSRELMENYKSTFYETGRIPSVFVKIMYDFKVSATQGNKAVNCSKHQSTYIWSQKFLYLLGPQPLFWYTFMGVHIPESSITIKLPCLCHHGYESLLSRLTHMV